jgi:hypothetical protein
LLRFLQVQQWLCFIPALNVLFVSADWMGEMGERIGWTSYSRPARATTQQQKQNMFANYSRCSKHGITGAEINSLTQVGIG